MEDSIKKEEDQGVGLELNSPTVGRKRKRPRMKSPEKVVKKEKVEAPPPKVKPDADMISKDSVKGHLCLIRKHLFNTRKVNTNHQQLGCLGKKARVNNHDSINLNMKWIYFKKWCARGHF